MLKEKLKQIKEMLFDKDGEVHYISPINFNKIKEGLKSLINEVTSSLPKNEFLFVNYPAGGVCHAYIDR